MCGVKTTRVEVIEVGHVASHALSKFLPDRANHHLKGELDETRNTVEHADADADEIQIPIPPRSKGPGTN